MAFSFSGSEFSNSGREAVSSVGEIAAGGGGGVVSSVFTGADSLHLLFIASGGHAHDAVRERTAIIIVI